MKNYLKTTTYALIALLALPVIAACDGATPQQQSPTIIGMPNPASAYCVERGGKLDMVEETAGTIGYCTLPNGTRVEEWALFRQHNAAE